MAVNGNQVTLIVLGGMILGVWLWLAFFETSFGTAWGLWGLLGLFMAAATYALRMAADDRVTVALWVAISLAMGMILAAVFTFQKPLILATLVTFTGGGFIAAGIPTPAQMRQAGPEWVVEDRERTA